MRKRKSILLLLVLLVTVAAMVGAYVWRSHEPEYKGVRVSVWLDDMPLNHEMFTVTGDQAWREAKQAVGKIGPRAVPYIVTRLKEDESGWRIKYRNYFPSLPMWLQKVLPKPRLKFTKRDASNAFLALGAAVKPELIDLLTDDHATVRSAAADTLGYLRSYNGTDIRDAIPGLTALSEDGDVEVCQSAVIALGHIGPEAAMAVPSLIPLLSASEKVVRPGEIVNLPSAAARTLGKIGPNAERALPSLKVLLLDMNPYKRNVATVAIWRISGDVTNTLPLLINAISYEEWEALEGLEEMGPQAKAAVPALIELTRSSKKRTRGRSAGPDADTLERITNAVVKIDPEIAAKVFGGGKGK